MAQYTRHEQGYNSPLGRIASDEECGQEVFPAATPHCKNHNPPSPKRAARGAVHSRAPPFAKASRMLMRATRVLRRHGVLVVLDR